jgi:hypothetical protein
MMRFTPLARRYAPPGATVLLLIGALVVWAAWPPGSEFAEVEGTITLDGKPLAEVEVQFLPDPEKSNPGPTASAYTDPDGRYKLRCEKMRKDGAILGLHRVCVIDITAIAPPGGLALPPGTKGPPGQMDTAMAPRGDKPKLSRVPSRYTDPRQTPLRDVEVEPGAHTLDFDLVSGKRN